MHKGLKHVVAAMALVYAGHAGAASPADAKHWRSMARADLDAIREHIIEGHPGVIDPLNPEFNTWVEEGYRQARAHIPYVVSYDTAMAVMRYYVAGFKDGHLMYSDDIRADFPILVTGWRIAWRDGSYVVASSLPGWRTPLPPVGATWVGCDGLSAEEVLQSKVAPYSDLRAGEQSRDRRATALWLRRPVAEDLRECSFRTPTGELRLPVAYQPITTEQWFGALIPGRGSVKPPANAFDVSEGVAWVRAGNFRLREGTADRKELESMLVDLAKLQNLRAVVFDSRGNRGGDSGIGDQIFEAATGGLDFDQTDINSLPRFYAQWRVSDFLVRYLDSTIEETKSIYGADSPRVAEDSKFRARVAAARSAGLPWVEQDAGRSVTREDVASRHGRLRRGKLKVALVTDSGCVSACLDFADIVLQVPGAVHAGQTTGADSVYMVGSRSRMPSGNALVMPVKVWRNRVRGNNEALVPDVPVDLGHDEASIRAAVIRTLGLD